VLIFSKKAGFSLGKIKKVATKRILSDPAKFFSCRIKRHLFGKQIALIQKKNNTIHITNTIKIADENGCY
jgi:hypothetical protein